MLGLRLLALRGLLLLVARRLALGFSRLVRLPALIVGRNVLLSGALTGRLLSPGLTLRALTLPALLSLSGS